MKKNLTCLFLTLFPILAYLCTPKSSKLTQVVRVRFAPSPTGPLHIGGVRTALYNYLFARQHKGAFILRIEDTDQNRFVPGAEEYIGNSLKWLGIEPDEGVEKGGQYGPYRQSDRKAMYMEYALQLVASGNAYYAFDTEDELKALREKAESESRTFKYDAESRVGLRNSLNMSADECQKLLENGTPWVIRLKVPANETVSFNDLIREHVSFNTHDLDDKVMMKADGMPTYHLANVVDDHTMAITHVIRGEEWLPSTPTHVLLYRAFGWEDTMPQFVHLPLLLKPNGKGKLSKRDGATFGFPVFPMDWVSLGDAVAGFKGWGYLPEATINFLAMLGWNDGTEKEIFSLDELVEAFSFERVSKQGAQFNIEKAKWFNQQYILHMDEAALAMLAAEELKVIGVELSQDQLLRYVRMFRERVTFMPDFRMVGSYLFGEIISFDQESFDKKIMKKWDAEKSAKFGQLQSQLSASTDFSADGVKAVVDHFVAESGLGFGDVLPFLRMALSGTLQGPAVFDMAEFLGKDETVARIAALVEKAG